MKRLWANLGIKANGVTKGAHKAKTGGGVNESCRTETELGDLPTERRMLSYSR